MKTNPKFADIPIGTVFQTRDGVVSESTTWFAFVKVSNTEAMLLVPDRNAQSALGWTRTIATNDLRLDSTQWRK